MVIPFGNGCNVVNFNTGYEPPTEVTEVVKNLFVQAVKVQIKALMSKDYDDNINSVNTQTDQILEDLLGKVAYYMNEFDINEYTLMGILEAVKLEVKESMTWEIDIRDDEET